MRNDQRIRLAEVAERLADVVIRDVDPESWAAADLTLAEMDRVQRGDAAWCRKTAVQSVALLVRVESLLGADPASTPPDDIDPEKEIARAEKAATKALERVMRGANATR